VTLASTGRWNLLARLLDGAGDDPAGRVDVARAALLLHLGDEDAYRELEARWSGERALRPQAEALLANAEKHPSVVLPMPTDG
jgi:hypothetical protein